MKKEKSVPMELFLKIRKAGFSQDKSFKLSEKFNQLGIKAKALNPFFISGAAGLYLIADNLQVIIEPLDLISVFHITVNTIALFMFSKFLTYGIINFRKGNIEAVKEDFKELRIWLLYMFYLIIAEPLGLIWFLTPIILL